MEYTMVIAYDGQRWDDISFKAYGDAMKANVIMAANPQLGICDRLEGGTILRVPLLSRATDNNNAAALPPWKR